MAEEVDQQFVEYIVKGIVDHPGDVKTERTIDEMGTLISLHVNAEDMGTIIGKEGRTAKALRTLLRVLGARNNARVNLKIIEPEGGRGMYPSREENSQDAEPASTKEVMGDEAEVAVEKETVEKETVEEKIAEEETAEEKKADTVADALSDLPQDELA